jgi:hypothetical protein
MFGAGAAGIPLISLFRKMEGEQMGYDNDFGWALAQLIKGKKVSRSGWNGKGMFLYYIPEGKYPASTGVAKEEWGMYALVPYQAYVAMKTVQGTVVPWLCSQTDMLAEDWGIAD